MKTLTKFAAIAAIALAAVSATAAPADQNYLLGMDEVAPQAAPTIEKRADGVYVVVMTAIDGRWMKYTLTPTTETRYGAFGEPVVKLVDIVPLP